MGIASISNSGPSLARKPGRPTLTQGQRNCVRKLLAAFLLLTPAGVSAQSNGVPAIARPGDPVCSPCSAFHYYREQERVKTGLSIDMLVGPVQAEQPIILRFFVSQRPSNWPEEKLEIEHEKFMHVIAVSDDLQEFFHLHPTNSGPGMWAVTHTFTNAGRYKFWSDVRFGGSSYTFGQPVVVVSGTERKVTSPKRPPDQVTVAGYQVTLRHSGPLTTGGTNQFQFAIRDMSGTHAQLENFLGAPMHLILIKDDLSVYLHAHPDALKQGDSSIEFNQSFPTAGNYRLFAQFRPARAKLPADEAILAEFQATVTLREDGASDQGLKPFRSAPPN